MRIELVKYREGILLFQVVSRLFEKRFEKFEEHSYFFEWLGRFNDGSAIAHADRSTEFWIQELLKEAKVNEQDLMGSIKFLEMSK
jgi:hypothetical protein